MSELIDLYRAQKIAEDRAVNPDWDKSFLLIGPRGFKECSWLDPYFGLFQIKGSDGFVRIDQIPPDIKAVMPEVES